MFKYHCLNPISAVGMNKLDENYVKTENADEADVILVRSAKMHEMEFGKITVLCHRIELYFLGFLHEL